MMSRAAAILAFLLVALSVAACGGSVGSGGSGAGTLVVTGAWVRAAPAGAQSAAYFTIGNGTGADDTLVGVSTTAAQSAGLHQTTTDSTGMTGMQMTESIKVPAGGSVALQPGGYHVMLTGLASALKAGASVELMLTFERAGVVRVTAEVRAS
jgi:periplasmic copper chaperone A